MGIINVRPTAEPFYSMAAFVYSFNTLALPQFVLHKVCHLAYNSTVCSHISSHPQIEDEIQAETANWMSVLLPSALVPALFMVLLIGPISEVVGRKKTMMLPPCIYFIQSCIFIVLTQIKARYSPGLLLLPYCLSGLFGDIAGATSLASAYISCITLPENRTVRMAVLESGFYIGYFSAAIASSVTVGTFGFTAGFVATAIVNFTNLVYVVFLLPSEDLLRPKPHRCNINIELATSGVNANKYKHIGGTCPPCEGAASLYRITLRDVSIRRCLLEIKDAICQKDRMMQITTIFILYAIALFINMGEVSIGSLFLKHSPFNMKAREIGVFASFSAGVKVFGLIVTSYVCHQYLHFSDIAFVILGFCVQMVYYTLVGLSVSSLMLYLVQILSFPMIVHIPVFRSMVTKLVDDDQHGSIVAAAEAVDVASSLVSSFLSNLLYSSTVNIFRGLAVCFLSLIALFGLIGSITYYLVFMKSKENEPELERLMLSSCEAKTNSGSSTSQIVDE
eukprot:Seg2085.6 transcript_id=Seg2085.6/GoldUCD/mRNA.D3Y31 product="Solute carrier family 46 member 3" protein_id=Seg2085.6/GoldUCD/D3Y31